jgi:peptidoglycan/LPS O-acetylase OafA/YrhL
LRRGMVFLATLAAVLAAGWLAWRFIEPGSAKKPAACPPPVPVTAAANGLPGMTGAA